MKINYSVKYICLKQSHNIANKKKKRRRTLIERKSKVLENKDSYLKKELILG
jgi:hypothetical protein